MNPISISPINRSIEERLRSLLEDYGHVLRQAIHKVAPRGLAPDFDDIEQEAKLRVWRAMEKQIVLERPASYLYRVAVNATLDAVNRHRNRREQPLDIAQPERQPHTAASPERSAMDRQMMGSISDAMAQIQPNRRRAVGLHLQGFTTSEIAEFFGWSEPKARNLAYRGLGDLRRHLQPHKEYLDQLEAI